MNPKQAVLRLALVALAATAAAAGVQAAGEGRQPSELFLQLDASHDGYVSRSEATGALLSGVAADRNQAQHAAQLASAVPGVERVENALKPK